MKILISNTSDTPLYQQIKDQIKDAIGTFVSTSNLELLRDSKRRLVEQKMADMIQTAKSLKISKEELNSMMDILYEED